VRKVQYRLKEYRAFPEATNGHLEVPAIAIREQTPTPS